MIGICSGRQHIDIAPRGVSYLLTMAHTIKEKKKLLARVGRIAPGRGGSSAP